MSLVAFLIFLTAMGFVAAVIDYWDFEDTMFKAEIDYTSRHV